MIAEIALDNVYSYIIDFELTRPEIKKELEKLLSYKVPGANFSDKFRRGLWDGRVRLINTNGRFPTGCAGLVISMLKDKGVKVLVSNNIVYPSPDFKKEWSWQGPALRDYQIEAVEECLNRHRGIIELPTRVGKTLLLAKVIQELGLKTLVVVPGKSAMEQFIEDVSGAVQGPAFGRIGAGKKEFEADIYVGIIETLRRLKKDNLKKLTDDCKLFVIDEVHRAGADGLYNFGMKMQSPYRFGLSATVFRTDNRDLRLSAVTGRIIYSREQSEMWEADVIEEPTVIWTWVQTAPIHREVNYTHHYMLGIIKCEYRNNLIRELVEKHVLLKDQIMVSVENVEHGKILYDLCRSYGAVFVSGQEKQDYVDKVVAGLKDGSIRAVISTRILNEALTFPDLSIFINGAGRKSPVELIQKTGRILGKGDKGKVIIYEFWDVHSHYLLKHSKERHGFFKKKGYTQIGV